MKVYVEEAAANTETHYVIYYIHFVMDFTDPFIPLALEDVPKTYYIDKCHPTPSHPIAHPTTHNTAVVSGFIVSFTHGTLQSLT